MRPNERFKAAPFTSHFISHPGNTPAWWTGVALHPYFLRRSVFTRRLQGRSPHPTDNKLFDLHSLRSTEKQGVLALFQDSTNVERKGYTPSERAVRRKFEPEIFRSHQSPPGSSPVFFFIDPSP